jgi:16S rRNA (adenine1518-N6/adenine1519-N6)-dimethyltransferase
MVRAKDTLKRMDVRPSRERGQNFIIDDSVIKAIVEFGNPQPTDNLVEVGPGLGAMTAELAHFGRLQLVELEKKFCDDLALKYPTAKIINRDVRKVDFSELGTDLVVFGNLPYVFSTDIVFHLIANHKVVKRAVLMLQREFAERMAAPPGGRAYGVLSIGCQMQADIILGPIISGDSFHPPTSVESRLVEMRMLAKPRIELSDVVWYQRVVKAAFSKRRKQLANSLKASGMVPVDNIVPALAKCMIDPKRRAETLSLQEFAALADALK